METSIKGSIKGKGITSGETNGKFWERFTFELDNGKSYSIFDKTMGDTLQIGDFIEVIGVQGEKYFKTTKINKLVKPDVMDIPVEKVKTMETPKPSKYREPSSITAEGLLRYSIKLFDSDSFKGGFVEAQEHTLQAYKEFLNRLNGKSE
jgi:hypothetical protein